MIDYIKNYNINSLEYEYVLSNLRRDVLDLFVVNEEYIKENIESLMEFGIKSGIAKSIVTRPDIFLLDKELLMENLSKIDKKIVVNIAMKSPEDLILLGI